MTTSQRVIATTLLATSLVLGGCATNDSSVFSSSQAQRIQTVTFGEVLDIREVTIEGNGSNIGTIAGAVVGAVAGSGIGGGRGRIVGGTVGAVVGGAVGNAVGNSVTQRRGVEFTIRLENETTVAITQEDDQNIRVGDRVRVTSDGNTARVSR